MRTLLPCLMLFLLYLVWERVALSRAQRRIPLRIAVTGTRGKSSVVRLLASILKEDGRRVIAKTTGSQAVILMPDGSQVELDRSVAPSILEQRRLIREAVRAKADCLVAEVMSIRPENHFVESQQLLQPNLVAITNVRRDHTELMGGTAGQIASVLSLDICARSAVFLPAKEDRAEFRAEAQNRGATVTSVGAGASSSLLKDAPGLRELEFEENLDLVCAIATHLGVGRLAILEGIRNARHDIGRLRIWRYDAPEPKRTLFLVNAFAANDPESTLQVLDKVAGMLPTESGKVVGVLNLRADRAARTMQWISALKGGGLQRFSKLYVTGDYPRAVQRRLPGTLVLKAGSPERMTGVVCTESPESSVIFGFGNVKGAGRSLAEYWQSVGELYSR